MLCSGDVATILAKLLTVDGHLPTGSSASPILSYFAYADMFTEISDLARQRECKMTIYIDDMTFSGPGATRRLIYDVRRIVKRYRLWAHKTKVFRPGQPKVVTGVAVTKSGSRLPNKRQKAIRKDLELYRDAESDTEKLPIARRLVSRMFEAAQVDSRWQERAEAMAAERRGLERKILFEAISAQSHRVSF